MNQDINDVFENIAFAENRFAEEGYADGYTSGLTTGWVEGYDLGIKKGSLIGSEVYFYGGFVLALKQLATENQLSERCLKALNSLESVIVTFPRILSDDSNFVEKLSTIRGKFRQICSLLSINSDVVVNPNFDF